MLFSYHSTVGSDVTAAQRNKSREGVLSGSIVHLVGPFVIYCINNCLGTVRSTQFSAGRSDISSCPNTRQLTEVSVQKIFVLVQVHCKFTVGLNSQIEIQGRKIKENP